MESFDYIIVGAGTAGCLLANRLSNDPSKRVLLLEAGGRDDYLWIHIPVGYLYCIGNPRTDWLYQTQPDPGLNGRAIRYPRGRVLGGCSSINGMIYMRGQAGDYDHWAALGNPGWSWEEVLPYFIQHEDYHRLDDGGRDPLHGHGGAWRVEQIRVRWEILEAFREAAAQVGVPKVDDFNRGNNFGCGYFEVNQKRGVRWNAAKAFLHPVAGRRNLTVLTQAQVSRVVLADTPDRRVLGVEVLPESGSDVVRRFGVVPGGELVMAAGAVHTPAILQASGIGPGSVLQAANVATLVDVPGIGENLQDHLQLRMVYKVRGVRTLNAAANSLLGKAWMGVQYLAARRGPLTMSPSQLGAFVSSKGDDLRPDLEYHVQPLSLDKFGEPLHRFPAFTASVCNLRPSSRGRVRISGPDSRQAPRIEPNYLATQDDQAVAAEAIRWTRRIVAAPALQRYAPEEYLPGSQIQSDADLIKAAGEIGTTIFHPVGTCRMGPRGDARAVVDGRLRMHAVPGIRIADASVMPTITSGNTNAPTLMIAEKAAAMIAEDRGSR
jgi:choline dehydrogenase